MRREYVKRTLVSFFTLAILVLIVAIANAQTSKTFDVVTFQVPKGWSSQATQDAFQISTEDSPTGAFCAMTVYRSVPAGKDPKENFRNAWQSLVKEAIGVSAAPEMQPSTKDGEWIPVMGSAAFEKDGAKGVAVLVTISGYGTMVNTVILTNSESYQSAIAAFLESAKLKKLESATAASVDVPKQPQPKAQNGQQLSLTSSAWKQSQSRKDAMGGYAGYSAGTYEFGPNNKYKFTRVAFQNYAPKYYVEDEEGTYTVSGSTIALKPTRATFRSYRSSRQEAPVKSGDLELNAARYNFEFMDLNNNWTLLLSPVDGVETKRDGQFSFWLNGEKRKTYSYNAVNADGELIR